MERKIFALSDSRLGLRPLRRRRRPSGGACAMEASRAGLGCAVRERGTTCHRSRFRQFPAGMVSSPRPPRWSWTACRWTADTVHPPRRRRYYYYRRCGATGEARKSAPAWKGTGCGARTETSRCLVARPRRTPLPVRARNGGLATEVRRTAHGWRRARAGAAEGPPRIRTSWSWQAATCCG